MLRKRIECVSRLLPVNMFCVDNTTMWWLFKLIVRCSFLLLNRFWTMYTTLRSPLWLPLVNKSVTLRLVSFIKSSRINRVLCVPSTFSRWGIPSMNSTFGMESKRRCHSPLYGAPFVKILYLTDLAQKLLSLAEIAISACRDVICGRDSYLCMQRYYFWQR